MLPCMLPCMLPLKLPPSDNGDDKAAWFDSDLRAAPSMWRDMCDTRPPPHGTCTARHRTYFRIKSSTWSNSVRFGSMSAMRSYLRTKERKKESHTLVY